MVNLELVALKVKCERQYQTIIKLQDEKIDLFKENQQLKEIIDEVREYVNYLHNSCKYRLNDGHLRKLEKLVNKALGDDK